MSLAKYEVSAARITVHAVKKILKKKMINMPYKEPVSLSGISLYGIYKTHYLKC
jgi:hypothetical protein